MSATDNVFVFNKQVALGSGRYMATINGVRSTWTGSAWIAASGYAGFGTTGLVDPEETTLDGVDVYAYDMSAGITSALNITLDVWANGITPVYDGSHVDSNTITWTGSEVFAGGGTSVIAVGVTVDDDGVPAIKAIAIAVNETRSFLFVLTQSDGTPLNEASNTYKLVVTDIYGVKLFQVTVAVSGADGNQRTATITAGTVGLPTIEKICLYTLWNTTKTQRRVEGSLSVQPSSPYPT